MPLDSEPQVIASCSTWTDGSRSTTTVSLPMPLPCITILVHGVNDVGEAYPAQEAGICAGLNARLNRSHGLDAAASPDLVASQYGSPPPDKNDVVPNPDAVYFRRNPNAKSRSPVVPFYWGFSELKSKVNTSEYHGEWTDRYGNRLDKNGAKNGGPFANATSTLNDMWGTGFSGKVIGVEAFAKWASEPTHNLLKARPRPYMLLGAQRLAMLIKMIRKQYPDVAINIVCHSQGSMITLAAHAFLAEDGGVAADTVIVQDPPYSLEEAAMEESELGAQHQQTTQSRIQTLANIVRYIGSKRAATPPLSDLALRTGACGQGVAGEHWKPGAGAQQVVNNQTYPFTERDNRGKFYLYFNPHDKTVSLLNVEGIGWQGVPDKMRVKQTRADGGQWAEVPIFSRLDQATFRQRMFTSRGVAGKPPLQVGAAPGPHQVPNVTGGMFSTNKEITHVSATSTMRTINGEALNPTIAPMLTLNEGEGKDAGKLPVNVIDSATAISAKGGMETTTKAMPVTYAGDKPDMQALEDSLPGQTKSADAVPADRLHVVSIAELPRTEASESMPSNYRYVTYTTETPNTARKRWQHRYDGNSYHSSIPANAAHAEGVTAYDLSLGRPLPIPVQDKESKLFLDSYMEYLRAVADWRTDWDKMASAPTVLQMKILERKASEKTEGAVDLIDANFKYYNEGVLPPAIANADDVVQLTPPPMIVSFTVGQRNSGQSFPEGA